MLLDVESETTTAPSSEPQGASLPFPWPFKNAAGLVAGMFTGLPWQEWSGLSGPQR